MKTSNKISSLLPKGVYALTVLKRRYKTKAEARQAHHPYKGTWIRITEAFPNKPRKP